MSEVLSLREHNLHKVRVGERTMMLHIPTNALYGIDEMTDTVLERVRAESLSADQLVQQLRGRFDEQELRETVADDATAFRATLARAQTARADLVLTTGAVSMGRNDFIPAVLEA